MGLIGKIFLASMPILMSMFAARYREEDRNNFLREMDDTFGLPVEEKFDFIIVGGGTAGCVLARRLSDAQLSVLLLETGGTPAPPQAVPAVYSTTEFNYNYHSTRQSNAGLNRHGIVPLFAGKMLGGSSSHNSMFYERGHPDIYNEWAEITGDPSWSYPELLKYFIMAENYTGDPTSRNEGQHGTDGPMSVVQRRFSVEKNIQLFLKAGAELGYASDIDPNGPQRQGFSAAQFTRDSKGRRVSTYTAHVKPVEKNTYSTLTVRRYSSVQQIVFENKTAVGVVYKRHGVPRIARATKEVILSAGAYMSPILLIRSGIGPEDQLKLAKVDPVSILPVGYNLIDHTNVPLQFTTNDTSLVYNAKDNLTSAHVTDFLETGNSPLSDGFVVAHIASPRAEILDKKPEWPDLMLFLVRGTMCSFNMVRPRSRGRLTLNASATGMEDDFLPIIDPNYYGDESDFNVTLFGIDSCFKIFEQTETFKKIGGRYADGPIKGCEGFEFKSREYWKCYIRQKSDSPHHACCSNRMGPMADGNSVVDPKFRVFGVKNLRVVDASVMPTVPNSNTAAPVVVLAEKAADILIQHYNIALERSNA